MPQADSSRTEERGLLAASVADFTRRASDMARVRKWRAVAPGYDRALWREMAALGWVGLRRSSRAGTRAKSISATKASTFGHRSIWCVRVLFTGDRTRSSVTSWRRTCCGCLLVSRTCAAGPAETFALHRSGRRGCARRTTPWRASARFPH